MLKYMPMYLGWRHFTRNTGVCPRCENSFLQQSLGVSLVNKCMPVFPSVTMTDFTTVVEDNTVSHL